MRVAVLDDYQGFAEKWAGWSQLGLDSSVVCFRDHVAASGSLVERLQEFDIVVLMRERTALGREMLDALPRLQLVVTTGRSNPSVDIKRASERGVVVSATGSVTTCTPELTWGLILGLVRHIPEEDRDIRRGGWQHTIGDGLWGKSLGLVGLGEMGRQVARVGIAFGMDVRAWSENLRDEDAQACGVRAVTKEQLFAESDIVTIHLRLSERTRGVVGVKELGLMRSTAYLINTSRGPLVEEAALLWALGSGRIAGAGLDVFDEEPLPREHPLRRMSRTVVTPHIGYVTHETLTVFFRDVVEDILAFLAGAPLRVLR
ncbi:MAG: D-2-hydroxyacid dehydrogenase family protein [Candidatus Dormibacteria bacterium]